VVWVVVVMKILSWNVRGLGGLEKRRDVRLLVGEKLPIIVCLQETKLQVCDDSLCASIWGSSSHSYSFRPSVGASGGLLTVWDSAEVEVWDSTSGDYFLFIHGKFVKTNEEFFLFNIYASCDPTARQALWHSLSARLDLLGGKKVCICGDFNAVRNVEERRSV
jgi:exonuclease III